ncbi:MAG TPA: ISAs1 family transposase, partial [Verrucomicrobiae bacterium]|nr:ISAs1 family transposase [Verrucomicrobiae bacterium]
MQKHPASSLADTFRDISDPRVNRTKDHDLAVILVIAISTFLCGGQTFHDMEEFGKAKLEWFKTFLALPNGIPSHDTFNRIFAPLAPAHFLECFLRWTKPCAKLTLTLLPRKSAKIWLRYSWLDGSPSGMPTPLRALFLFTMFFTGCARLMGKEFDVVIYGGTSAAVAAAVQVSRMGKTVVLVSPDKHLGGLSSGGLGFTDTGNKAVIGGIAREFYGKIYEHYQTAEAWRWQQKIEYGNKGQGTPAVDGAQRTMWIFEPHVAEAIFEQWVRENGIELHRNAWLDREKGVRKEKGRIRAMTTLDGTTYGGRMFIDA